jgi:plastocyanin
MRLTFVLAALGIAVLALAALSFGSGAQAATVTVDTGNYYFCDQSHTNQVCETAVTAGDTVTWSASAGTHHVVQCTDDTFATCSGGFDQGTFSSGQTKSQTLNAAGSVYYHCAIHPGQMKGKIAVAAASTPTPTPSPTAAATQTAAPTATPAKVPATGGPPDDGSSNVWQYVLLGAGGLLIVGAAAAFVIARRNR